MPVNSNLLDLLCLDWERGLPSPECSFLAHPLDQQGQLLQFPVPEAHGLLLGHLVLRVAAACSDNSSLPNSPGQGWSHLETQPLV